jgi:diguanylate cyclase (GGDEF)-like protein
MTNVQVIFNAILSKKIFEYILINKEFKIVNASLEVSKYLDAEPKVGDEIFDYLPELTGYENELTKVFQLQEFSFNLNTIQKNNYYMNVSLDHYSDQYALILLQNITKMTQSQQKLLQYSNETTLLYQSLQKIIDAQNALIFVMKSNDEIVFANQGILDYFNVETKESLSKVLPKLYKEIKNIHSYEELFSYIGNENIHINVGHDRFILQITLIEETHRLFTLSKVTDIFEEKQKLKAEIEYDELTQVYRKKYFDLKLQEIIKSNEKFALVVVDIDDFKAVNDSYGHIVGDEVLKTFATLLKSAIYQDELVARWGGEEFLLVIKSKEVEEVLNRIECLRQTIESHDFNSISKLTASFGVAWKNLSVADDIDNLLHRADKALYMAKTNGKNRVILKKLETIHKN